MRRFESVLASDADRDAVTDRLRDAAGEGRLQSEELEERVDAALHARTYGELRRLVADLPRDGKEPWLRPRMRTTGVARSVLLAGGLATAALVALVLVALVVLLVLAVAAVAAAWCAAVVILWLVRSRSRRLARGPMWRHQARARHIRRPRTTGFL
jgi:Flp pilus assembly protein TadB